MPYEFLPRPNPGDPSMRFPPGFRDGVRQRIAHYQRQQRRRRIAILVTTLALVATVAGAYLLYRR